MEKMYTRQDLIRYIAKERDRCINEAFKEGERVRKQIPKASVALKGTLRRAKEYVDHVFYAIVNGKMEEKGDYEEQLLSIVERDYFGDVPPVAKVDVDGTVFPSEEKTIQAVYDETYGGAHCYIIRECLGFADGRTSYVNSEQVIQFIQKLDDGSVIPGLQSEQVVLALIDRHRKLNARFPSAQNEKMIRGLEMFLEASRERVEDRMNRGVMGNLQN